MLFARSRGLDGLNLDLPHLWNAHCGAAALAVHLEVDRGDDGLDEDGTDRCEDLPVRSALRATAGGEQGLLLRWRGLCINLGRHNIARGWFVYTRNPSQTHGCGPGAGKLREPPLAEQDQARQQEHAPRHTPDQLPTRQHLFHQDQRGNRRHPQEVHHPRHKE